MEEEEEERRSPAPSRKSAPGAFINVAVRLINGGNISFAHTFCCKQAPLTGRRGDAAA